MSCGVLLHSCFSVPLKPPLRLPLKPPLRLPLKPPLPMPLKPPPRSRRAALGAGAYKLLVRSRYKIAQLPYVPCTPWFVT